MYRFVVFLKGINVGGHIVVKDKLKGIFASLGFQNVFTYKQSGNVVFDTDIADPREIQSKIEEKLYNSLGYDIAVFPRKISQLKSLINLDPFKSHHSEGSSFLVTFLATIPTNFQLPVPLTIPKSTAQIISWNDLEIFSVTHGGGEGALPNHFLETKLKVKATTRNLNTLKEIVEKYA